jgi:hypothetical protein
MHQRIRRLTALEEQQSQREPAATLHPIFWERLDRAYGDGVPSEPMTLVDTLALIDTIYAEEEPTP